MEIVENILCHIGSFAVFMVGMTIICLIMMVATEKGKDE
jgi:hypothetical protein